MDSAYGLRNSCLVLRDQLFVVFRLTGRECINLTGFICGVQLTGCGSVAVLRYSDLSFFYSVLTGSGWSQTYRSLIVERLTGHFCYVRAYGPSVL